MRTIEHKLLKFEELNEEQKEKVIDNHRNWNVDGMDWYEFVYEDAKIIAELMGIDINDIYFSGFWSQGDGACFSSSVSYNKNLVKKVKEHAPLDEELHRMAETLAELHRKSFYTAYGRTFHRGHYYHSGCMVVDIEAEKGHVDYDEWDEALRDFADWIYKRLENEYEYQTSDEVVSESLIADEMEFEVDEDGELIL